MLTVQPSLAPSIPLRSEPNPPTAPTHSVTSQVIEFFHKRLNDRQGQPAPSQSSAPAPHPHQRIEQLLRFAVTKERPSLAEQIRELVENTREPLTETTLGNQVEQLLNQPSALDSRKTYAQLIKEILESLPPSATNSLSILSRGRRHALDTPSATASQTSTVSQFADALVDRGDRQLAMNIANSLVRQRLAFESHDDTHVDETVAIPPDSTFGQVWAELGDALNSEPFKSFAETHLIDISNAAFTIYGDLYDISDGKTKQYSLAQNSDWAGASAAVLAAVKKVCTGSFIGINGYDRNYATAAHVAWFYGMEQGNIPLSDTLFNINQLMRDGTFNALSNTDPLYAKHYAPIKQRQRDARQRIAELPLPQLKQRLEEFAPLNVSQNIQEADRALAEQSNRGLLKLLLNPQDNDYESPVMLNKIPEYSTFNQARKNLLTALTGSAFTTFVQENQIDPTSVSIHPITGALNGKKKGIETGISLNDISGWSDVWEEVKDAVQQMAAGSQTPVQYPNPPSAKLNDVLNFYNEPVPRQLDASQTHWQRLNLVSVLERSAALANNNGFNALVTPPANDTRSTAIQKVQADITEQLIHAPVPPSKLQDLAASVESSLPGEVNNTQTPEDDLLSNESKLAVAMHRVMLELSTNASNAASKTIESIPINSQLGQWLSYFDKALKARGFTEWAHKQNIDLNSLRFDPNDKALIGKVHSVDQRFTAADVATKYPEYFDVLQPVLTAAQKFTARGKPITLAQVNTRSAPFEWASNFYGVSTDYSSSTFQQQTALMGRTQQFPRASASPEKVVSGLKQQKTELGNSNDRYALIRQLKNDIALSADNQDSGRFIVDPDSSHQPKGVTTAERFLTEKGLKVPQSKADTDNLLLALNTPLPQPPELGNYWGFLSKGIPLSADQRRKMTAFVNKSIGSHDGILSYLSASVPNLSTQPAQALEQLLNSNNALELATNLQTEMKGTATGTSLKQWLLSALVLELDPSAGTRRNTVAGFDLMGDDNWGHSTQEIQQRFGRHLTDKKIVPANLAPAASRLLMLGMAPHLLVKDVPQNITVGSTDWVSLTTAVNRIEWIAPGASAGMTFQQVMDFHKVQPISDSEALIQGVAQMNPVIDWAILNKHLVKNDNDEYSLEQLKSSQTKLQQKVMKLSAARSWLRDVKPPIRRAMALEALKEKFGSGIDYESKYMLEGFLGGAITGIRASLVEIYEAGRMDELWVAEGKQVDFNSLRERASELPNITEQFDKKIEEDYALRRANTKVLFEEMIQNMPADERQALKGSLSFLRDGGPGSPISLMTKEGWNLRFFSVDAANGKITRIPDIETSSALRQPDAHFYSLTSFEGSVGEPSLEGRLEYVINDMLDGIYLKKKVFVSTYRNYFSNGVETGREPGDIFREILRALPGGSSLLDIYHGEYANAVKDLLTDIVIYAATEGVGKLWTLAKAGAGWTAAKLSAKYIEKFGANEAQELVLRDVTTSSTSPSLNSASRMQRNYITEQTADMSNGTLMRSDAKEQIRATAVFKDGDWYAYDTKTLAPYGPALENFVSDTSSAVEQETFSDGAQALVTEKPMAADAYTVTRTHGFDLINEGKVYRYDTREPGLLRDLESADYYKPLEDFEAFCPAPGLGERVKRGANDTCFTKVVEEVSGELGQELQALEHVRLFPSTPKFLRKDQFVIFERRRWKMVDGEMGPQLHPVPESKPIAYKPKITGTLKNEPEFGFFNAQSSDALERETRVVKLNRISDAVDDKREVRGVIVNGTVGGSTAKYLVIEADTAEFYYARLGDAPGGELTFNKCTPNELSMVTAYRNKFSIRQGVAKVPFDANFIALPKLNAAFEELERVGYLKADIDELKASCKELTDEQKREVVYQLQRAKAIDKADIALRPNQVFALAKPSGFATWTTEQQNKFYAEQAKDSVNRSMKATGLGPDNQIRSKADLARAGAAGMAIGWLRRTVPYGALNHSDLILKSGAGNCGEMALLSKDIIKKSGGRAYEWAAGDAHAFTVVGGPPVLPPGTPDFSEAAWADAWIVDPWANIACPARDYTQQLKKVMGQWEHDNLKIIEGGQPISPVERNWMNKLVVQPKTPLSHGYIGA